jgi:histone acetyltransferase (RNA polymerase elongator complex component)
VVKTTDSTKHFTIPVFIPDAGCPFRCIFCDQPKITGKREVPSAADVEEIIVRHLSTIPDKNPEIWAGFFGGTFTGLPSAQQQNYLRTVAPFIKDGRIQGIRLSTRPDYITKENLLLLKRYGVKAIELGAQSMDDEVLRLSHRGHTSADTERASRMITEEGFVLGLQMMVGLPGDSGEKSLATAKRFAGLGAGETRIYPVLVLAGSEIEKMYQEGTYSPLPLEEAIRRTKELVIFFDSVRIKILRIGLHPSEDLSDPETLIAGPFHPSFRELVQTEIWNEKFRNGVFSKDHSSINIHVNPADLNNAIGYSGKNRKFFEEHYRHVKFFSGNEIPGNTYHVDYC